MKQPYLNSLMASLLAEPSLIADGFADGNVDTTITETKTFLRDTTDEDSDVVFTRQIEKNADGDILSISTWSIANAPTVTDVSTDQDDDATVARSGTTELTITGSNFGAEDTDIEVYLFVRQRNKVDCIAPTPFKNRIRIPATITSISVGDDAIIAEVTLESLYGYDPGPGPCEVLVFNHKRLLVSEEFQLTVL